EPRSGACERAMTRDGTVGRFRRNRAKPGASSGHRSRLNDEDSVRGPHQGQQSTRTAPTGRTHDCKRPLCGTLHFLLPGGGHPHMRRRKFISLIAAGATWPLAARAQQSAVPVIGLVNAGSREASASRVAAFRKGLSETGYVEGQNVAVEYHWFSGEYDRLPALMADLVGRRVAVIATPGSTPAASAAKAATTTIPIVFGVGEDPVKLGLVASLARPGGNATGINILIWEVAAKRLGLLHELAPRAGRVAVLINPGNAPSAEATLRDLPEAARGIGLQIQTLNASTSREIEAAFATLVRDRADALFVAPDSFFISRRVQFATLAM